MLTLLFTDTHTRNNGIPDERASRYFDAVAAVASSLGFSTARLGACIPPGLLRDVDAEVATPASLEAWRGHPLRGRLVEQARRHVEGDVDVESAAHRYLVLCAHEGRALVERFSDHLFLSYNPPAMDLCTPPLPTLHLYSMRAKTSVKPWFTS